MKTPFLAFLIVLSLLVPAHLAALSEAPPADANQGAAWATTEGWYFSDDGNWTAELRTMSAILDGEERTLRVYFNRPEDTSRFDYYYFGIYLPEGRSLSFELSATAMVDMLYTLEDLGGIGGGYPVALKYIDPALKNPDNYYLNEYEMINSSYRGDWEDKVSDFELCIDRYDTVAKIATIYVKVRCEYLELEGFAAMPFNFPSAGSAASSGNSSGSSASGSSLSSLILNSGSSGSSSFSFETPEPDCMSCHGTGSCPMCNGSGTYRNYGNSTRCGACGGSGDCGVCGGTGKR